jgi:HAD superfamily hydrolase (TIGR01509 family)
MNEERVLESYVQPDLSTVDTLFWDNDGILVDTEYLYYKALKSVLLEYTYELRLEDFIHHSLGMGKSIFQMLLEKEIIKAEWKELQAHRDELYMQRLLQGIAPMRGVKETLEQLSQHYHMAIVTSSKRKTFDIIHAETGLLSFFDFVLTSDDISETKPSPEPYLSAAKMARRSPDQCLVIEDSPRGALAAERAGMHCVILPTQMTEKLGFPKSSIRLQRIEEVLDLLSVPNSSNS